MICNIINTVSNNIFRKDKISTRYHTLQNLKIEIINSLINNKYMIYVSNYFNKDPRSVYVLIIIIDLYIDKNNTLDFLNLRYCVRKYLWVW